MKVVVEEYDKHNGRWEELFEWSASYIECNNQVLTMYSKGKPYWLKKLLGMYTVDKCYVLGEREQVRWLNG